MHRIRKVLAALFVAVLCLSFAAPEVSARPHLPFKAARAAKNFVTTPGFPAAAAVAEHVKEGIQRRHERRVDRRHAVARWLVS